VITLQALGPIELRAADGRSLRSVISQEKRLALLTYLAVGQPDGFRRRDRLLGLFWADSDESHARNSLNQALFQLRRSLGEDVVVSRGADEVGIDADRFWCDAAAFSTCLKAGELAKAVELYRGELLEGLGAIPEAAEWEHWLEAERASLHRGFVDALRSLARAREAAGDIVGAAPLWRRLTVEAPLDAVAALGWMRVLASEGDRAGALEHGRQFEARIREELGADPDPEVASFAERLRDGSAEVYGGTRASAEVRERQESDSSTVPAPERAVLPLPVPSTQLVGRTEEIRKVQQALARQEVRLLTLTGAGGVGKTRLALEIARSLRTEYALDVAFVSLGSVSAAEMVVPAIADALGVREAGWPSLADALRDRLADARILLVLDNFEHVAEAAVDVAGLLSSAPRLKVLVTSRAALRISTEHEYPVTPLGIPAAAPEAAGLEYLRYPAVELFVARASAVRGDFALLPENADDVAEICRLLDGLPLAIELAAARTRVLTPAEIRNRLDNRLRLLTGGAGDLPERQRTLRSAIDWSYELLTPEERQLFRRLAAFPAGARIEAIEAVCCTEPEAPSSVLDVLESLVAKSLLIRMSPSATGLRFRMLQTLREYALERLAQDPAEAELVAARHATFFLRLAEEAEPQLAGGAQGEWVKRLEEEHDNLLAAFSTARDAEDAEPRMRFAVALWRFWWLRGHLNTGRRWATAALAGAPQGEMHAAWRARTQLAASALALYQGDLAESRELAEEALVTFEGIDDRRGVADALSRLGQEAWRRGDHSTAHSLYDRSLDILREQGEVRSVAVLLFNLGSLAIDQGRYDDARRLYADCLTVNEKLGNEELAASVELNRGMLEYRCGRLEQARRHLDEGIAVARSLGSKQQLAGALNALGLVLRDLGDLVTAHAHLVESYSLQIELGDRLGTAHSAHSLGSLAVRTGDLGSASRLLSESVRTFGSVGLQPPPVVAVDLGELTLLAGMIEHAVRLLALAARWDLDRGLDLAASDRARFDRIVSEARSSAGEEVWARETSALSGEDLDAVTSTVFEDVCRALADASSPARTAPSRPAGSRQAGIPRV
jgi:predicted ATPase/DNA-binding SARP family transcriptional activator